MHVFHYATASGLSKSPVWFTRSCQTTRWSGVKVSVFGCSIIVMLLIVKLLVHLGLSILWIISSSSVSLGVGLWQCRYPSTAREVDKSPRACPRCSTFVEKEVVCSIASSPHTTKTTQVLL